MMLRDPLILSEVEWLTLEHESSQLLKVYLAMRWQQDPATGVAGPLETSFFRRALYVLPPRGRADDDYPTTRAVRSALAKLERLGLIIPRPDLGKGMFVLPLSPRRGPLSVPVVLTEPMVLSTRVH